MSDKNRLPNHESDTDLKRVFESTLPPVPPVDLDELASMLPNNGGAKDGLVTEEDQVVLSSRNGENKAARSWSRVTGSLASLAVIALLAFLFLRSVPENAAFADVQARVERLKTVQFTNYRTYPNEEGTQPSKLRVKILGRHLQITEVIGQPGRYDLIDSLAGRLFSINTEEKVFREFKTRVVIDNKTGRRTESEFKLSTKVDFYHNMTSFPEHAFQRLASGWVGERPALQFKQVHVNGLAKRTISIWVDAVTQLPLHVEIQLRSKDPAVESVDFIYTDFVYDEPLDHSLFNTSPPPGFQVVAGEFIERK